MGAHALLVGISRFEDPKLAQLNSPQSDVAAFARVLQDPARSTFDSVTVSIDGDLLSIRDQISALFDGRSADDMVLFYYSGHGIVAKGQRLYLATGQSSFDKPQARSVAASEVRDMMEQSRAGRLVVILDCCHSGVFADGAKGAEAAALTDTTFGDGDGAEGQYVLTATDALQYAFDGKGDLRPGSSAPVLSGFTQWLVDGIGKGEAAPFDEQITLDALYQYLCKRARTAQAGMTPQRFVKRGSGELVIARNPSAKAAALPDALIAKLDSTEWRTRKDAVAELAQLAKQPRMAPLAKKIVLDRISDERDVEVREAMLGLIDQLRPAPSPSPVLPTPDDLPHIGPKPTPKPVPPPPMPSPKPIHPSAAPTLDEWQTRVLIRSGVASSLLTGPDGGYFLLELQRRANGLRIATYMHRSYIAAVIFFGLAGIGQASNGEADYGLFWALMLIGFGVAGLLTRTKVPPNSSLSGNTEFLRMQEAVPLIVSRWGWGFGWSKREYDATLYHRACWWMVIGGAVTFLFVAAQT